MTLGTMLALKFRGLPVGRIKKAISTAEAAGITLSVEDISTHLQCRRAVEPVVEALILAKREGVATSWTELAAVDLATAGLDYDLVKAVRTAAEVRELAFSTFAKDLKEPLGGVCGDGSRIRAECKVRYRLPVSHLFAPRLDALQERLATRIGAQIFDSPDSSRLKMSQSEHESSLLTIAHGVMPTVQSVAVKYETSVPGQR